MKGNYMKSYVYLSEVDLRKISEWYDDYPTDKPEAFLKLLFKHGINEPIDCIVDTHRPRTDNKPFTGRRWLGEERLDRQWLNSGLATIEAYMASSDAEIQKDMSNMSRRYTVAPKDGEADESN